ncbi:PREDICTED: uncharacterized protein LOC106100327 [Papilio polytes]|uniref:uncharacterized protein LOC106100327 n=1 Tax=Papilio polytes TaxID=76194 RepID=UPI0006763431|nr:PREDICTED: uncharacterized protein LOC106100327 [Papilio polytes]
MYWRASTYVRSAAGDSDRFGVSVGLHQGSALSPYLFLLVMDALTLNIQEEAPWCMLYADDIVLVGEDECEVQNRLEEWRVKLEGAGVKISRTKTEHLFCDFGGPTSFSPIALNGVPIPTCSDFKYLCSLVQSDGGVDRDVKSRINAGWMKWRQVTGVTCDPRMPLRLKGQIYKSIIRPVSSVAAQIVSTAELESFKNSTSSLEMKGLVRIIHAPLAQFTLLRGAFAPLLRLTLTVFDKKGL